MNNLLNNDPEIASLIKHEEERQRYGINLIASENYVYPEVLEVMGSVLANKYAEGYPGKRYYAGCEWVDQAESLAIERSKALFNAEHVNVQPHSGSAANMAVLMAVLKPGDNVMGMSLTSGGHLTHGHPASFSGLLYNAVAYDVDPITELLDYDKIETLAQKHKPKLIIAGASSYSRIIDFEKFHAIAQSINAKLLVDCAHTAGLIAAGLYPNPVPFADFVTATTHKTLRGPRGGFIMCKKEYQDSIDRAVFPLVQGGPFMNAIAAKAVAFKRAQEDQFKGYLQQSLLNAQAMVGAFKERGYRIVSDGTDTHLFVVDLRNNIRHSEIDLNSGTLRSEVLRSNDLSGKPANFSGKDAEKVLEEAGIYVSRSTIPFDKQKPWLGSGIRIGTLAITCKGFTENESILLAHRLDEILSSL